MSILETRMQNLRASSYLDKNEERTSRYGAFELFRDETASPLSIVTPEIVAKAVSSIGRTLQTPVIERNNNIKVTNVRKLTIEDADNTSHMVDITFATLSVGFTVVPAAFHNNEISVQRDFERQMIACIHRLGATMDTMAITALEAAKTKVFADKLAYTITADTVNARWGQRKLLLGDLNSMMGANDYFNPDLRIVGTAGVESLLRELKQSDLYNAENKRNEYDNKVIYMTNNLKNEEESYGSLFAVEPGQVALLHRFEREALYNRKTEDGHAWGTTLLPIINMPVGTYYYEEVGDYSTMAGAATSDMTRALKECYEFSVDLAFVTPYNSAPETNASPIMSAVIKHESDLDAIKVKNIS